MKKVIVLLLGLGLVFSGCGASADSGKTTIQVSFWDDINDETSYIKEFEKENPDIDIEVVQIPADDYSQKMLSLQSTKNVPDVMLLMESDYPVYAENGYIAPITEQVESSEEMNVDNFIPSISDIMYAEDGEIYGLPWSIATQLLYYNKDMFDEAGVDYPTADWTYNDYEEAAKALTKGEGDNITQYGSDAITDSVVWYSMVGEYNNGNPILDENGKFDIEEGIKGAIEEESKLTNELGAMPSPTSGTASADLFMSGQAAMTRQGSWYMSIYKDLEFNWDVAPLPAGTNDYAALHTGFFTVSSKTEHPEEAWKFVEFMLSDTGQELLMQESHNASSRTDVANPDAWQEPGVNGPTNWEAFTDSLEYGEIGQGFINRTIYDNLALKMNEYVSGTSSLEDVIAGMKNANEEIE